MGIRQRFRFFDSSLGANLFLALISALDFQYYERAARPGGCIRARNLSCFLPCAGAVNKFKLLAC